MEGTSNVCQTERGSLWSRGVIEPFFNIQVVRNVSSKRNTKQRILTEQCSNVSIL